MALSEQWERRLDTAYEWGSTAFLSLTKSGNIIGLLAPSQLGKGTVDEWNELNGTRKGISAPVGMSFKSVLDVLRKVEKALLNLGLVSGSLSRLKNGLIDIVSKDGNAALAEHQVIAGYDENALISFTNEEVLLSYSNMVNFIGLDAAKKIVKLQDNEDRLLMVSFLDISLGSRGFQGTKNVPTRRTVRSEQLSFRGEARGRHKMSNVNSSNAETLATADFSTWNAWGINYPALKQVFARFKQTIASATEMEPIIDAVAAALNVPSQAVQVVLHLECGWPDHIGRAKTGYRASMTRDDGSTSYRGVTQAGKGFWIDVSGRYKAKGITVAGVPERATLAEQIAAPFVYLDRYRNTAINGRRLTEWPLTPGLVYSFHQQSLQGLGSTFKQLTNASGQSGPSLNVIRTTAKLHRRAAPMTFI